MTVTEITTTRTEQRNHTMSNISAVLRSEWIKFATVRSNKILLALTAATGLVIAGLNAVLVTDEVLTVAEVFIYPTVLAAVLASVAGILLFSAEAQHGTLAAAISAHPGRSVIVASKAIVATGFGVVSGVVGMMAGFVGAVGGGLAMGDTSGMAATTLWALVYTSVAALLGLGVGMIVRHSAGAISGLLVWWLVVENLMLQFAPAEIARFLPFDAGFRLLEMASDFDTPEIIAAALSRPLYALIFGGYAVAAVVTGTLLLHRRDVA